MTNYLDLFSGIGGFSLGAYWAGLRFTNHYFSEVDSYAIKVYQQRFPGAVGLGDIKTINGADLPQGDWIISGGFPCQDISVAGKGAGLAGARSGLWFEYARIIEEIQPSYVVIENVGALTRRGLDTVLRCLAEIGYDAEWQDIRASDVGAPHRRERIWIVAYPHAMCESRSAEPRKQLERPAQSIGGGDNRLEAGTDVADTESWKSREPPEWEGREDSSGRGKKINELADSPNGGNVRRNRELEPAERQVREYRGSAENGRGEWWKIEPAVCELVDGLPAGLGRYEGRTCMQAYERVNQLKCLGNSIVPQIAELIFRQAAFDEWRVV